ncbi:hypothetical protein DDE84_04185 [Bifidobacterium tibiigranuli]|uniref:Transposase n=1 Tax=Bifidobacterium tibiigranuli TaxID=2172043 RepID=A0A5N6S3H1_9BIFI|nr:hypothetical protein DDE84_04185 [Bifidobacterium tibiigranuli]
MEVWYGLVERQAVRCGVFKSVKGFNSKLRTCIDDWIKRAHSFIRARTAGEILKKANRPTTTDPRH